jgi:hypothetical protein
MAELSGIGHLLVVASGSAPAVAPALLAVGLAVGLAAVRLRTLASLTETSESRPSATAAMQTITTPRPAKKPICSIALANWPPSGRPCAGSAVVQIGASALPTRTTRARR